MNRRRIAIVSDIHGNRTAFEAVLADLRTMSPDVVFHGGDLADGGSSPAEIVDRIRELGWPGVLGNADEMLPAPETLDAFTKNQPPQLHDLFSRVREIADWTRGKLGRERLAWLGALPRVLLDESFALVHAGPKDVWRSPRADAGDAELESVYGPLAKPIVVYGHIHCPFIRRISKMIVANSGSVGLPYDSDRRASYLLIDNNEPTIRRVEYDVDIEGKNLVDGGIPHAEWIGKMLQSGRFQMP